MRSSPPSRTRRDSSRSGPPITAHSCGESTSIWSGFHRRRPNRMLFFATSPPTLTRNWSIACWRASRTAFMGLTVGCAKCHDHFYDPIKQRDFYAMKALFDPLVARKMILASPAEIFAGGNDRDAAERERVEIDRAIEELTGAHRKKLYDDRVAMLPPEVQVVIRKPERERTADEQKIADDYYPI